jgi:hypothetical protein
MNSMPWLQDPNPDRLEGMVVVSILAIISLAWDGISICRNPVSWKIGGYTAQRVTTLPLPSADKGGDIGYHLTREMLTDPLRDMPELSCLTMSETFLLKTF